MSVVTLGVIAGTSKGDPKLIAETSPFHEPVGELVEARVLVRLVANGFWLSRPGILG